MVETTKQAREAIVRARERLAGEADDLALATRSALDVPAKVRRHPAETAALAGGAAFLAVGGPKRVLRTVQRRFFPGTAPKYRGTLPRGVERTLSRAGVRSEEVKARIEKDFAAYLEEKGSGGGSRNAATSFWKTYDTLVGPLGKVAAARLSKKLFAAEPDRPRAGTREAWEADRAARAERAERGARRAETERLARKGNR